MEHSDITIDVIQDSLSDLLYGHDGNYGQPRKIRLYTGTGGADMFEDSLEFQITGRKRVYIGFKVLRILRRIKMDIRKSHSGRYFKTLPA